MAEQLDLLLQDVLGLSRLNAECEVVDGVVVIDGIKFTAHHSGGRWWLEAAPAWAEDDINPHQGIPDEKVIQSWTCLGLLVDEIQRHGLMLGEDGRYRLPEPEGKRQHRVEVLNAVDSGTSILVNARPRDDFTAATAIQAMAGVFLVHGLPRQITCARDPRFVGGWQGRDFPSAFGRFLASLDIVVDVCPPRRPDLNPLVERYHRSYEHECLRVHRPHDLVQTVEVTEAYYWYYNTERPNQALTCSNRPPHVAHPVLPLLPRPPDRVDPDHWVQAIDRQRFKRRVQRNGMVQVDRHRYYVGRRWRRRLVNLQVDAAQRQLVVYVEGRVHKRLPIQGLYGERLDFADYLDLIGREAVSEWQRWLRQQGRRRG